MRMPTRSLSAQLLLSVGLLLALFFGVTVVVLDYVFRDISESGIAARLDVQVLALIAASEERPGGGLAPQRQLVEPRFNNPGSGLYGEIAIRESAYVWRSPSLLATGLDFAAAVPPGRRALAIRSLANGSKVMALSVGLAWEFSDGRSHDVNVSVAESLESYYAQLNRFRLRLFSGFGGLAVLLVGALALLLRKELRPLRQIEHEIGEIEAGRLAELGAGYPRELAGVTANMNALLRSERERLRRYRNAVGNLAHSLKTPLAVIRNAINRPELRDLSAVQQLDEQVSRMDDIVRYQLKRAAASAGTALGSAPVRVREVLVPLRSALLKVYFDRDIDCELNVADDCQFVGDQGDLTEIAGNLLDNAFKWCKGRIRLNARNVRMPQARHADLLLIVEDDGSGIAPEHRQQVLERGARLDERVSGQGIGLSVVRELTELYRGHVEIGDSELGGARVTVRLPGMSH